jgi:acyl dehydratase
MELLMGLVGPVGVRWASMVFAGRAVQAPLWPLVSFPSPDSICVCERWLRPGLAAFEAARLHTAEVHILALLVAIAPGGVRWASMVFAGRAVVQAPLWPLVSFPSPFQLRL